MLPPWTAPTQQVLLPPQAPTPAVHLRSGIWGSGAELRLRLAAVQVLAHLRGQGLASPLGARLRPLPHQLGVAHRVIHGFGRGALLADEVGLGKTIEAGLVLHELLTRQQVHRALVLVPAALLPQWEEELRARFRLRPWVYGRDGIGAAVRSPSLQGVVLASLQTARRQPHARNLQAVGWDLVIVDEAHRLKSSSSQAHQFVASLGAPWLLLLTATPVQNSLRELHALVTLIDPLVLGSAERFEHTFLADASGRKVLRAEELRRRLATVMVRNRRATLPDLVDAGRTASTVRVVLSPSEKALYDDLSSYLAERYRIARAEGRPAHGFLVTLYQRMLASSFSTLRHALEARHGHLELVLALVTQERRSRRSAGQADQVPALGQMDLTSLGELWLDWRTTTAPTRRGGSRSATQDEPRFDPARRWVEDLSAEDLARQEEDLRVEREQLGRFQAALAALPTPTKVRRVGALVDELAAGGGAAQGRQVVLFTEFLRTQAEVSAHLRQLGHAVVEFHGGLSPEAKEEAIATFRGGAAVLVSTEAGAEGRNLQWCSTLVNLDLPWNPMRVEQRIGRLHRLGQQRTVQVVNLVSAGTVEEEVLELLAEKIGLFESVMGDLDLILGEVTSDLPLERVIMDAIAHVDPRVRDKGGEGVSSGGLAELGERFAAARAAYGAAHDLMGATVGALELGTAEGDVPLEWGLSLALHQWLLAWAAARGFPLSPPSEGIVTLPTHPSVGALSGRWRLPAACPAPGVPADVDDGPPLLWMADNDLQRELGRSLQGGATALLAPPNDAARLRGFEGIEGLVVCALRPSDDGSPPVMVEVAVGTDGSPLPADLPSLPEVAALCGTTDPSPAVSPPPPERLEQLLALALGRLERTAPPSTTAPVPQGADRWHRLEGTLRDHYADQRAQLQQEERTMRQRHTTSLVRQRSAAGERRRALLRERMLSTSSLDSLSLRRAALDAQEVEVLAEVRRRHAAAPHRAGPLQPLAVAWLSIGSTPRRRRG